MAEIGGQQRHAHRDVAAVAIPGDQGVDCEGMPEAMNVNSRLR